ncbi:MAG: hypothetical protein JSW58_15830 [Candidatus Latescibacterota bacterium]|nr:MAG: hypothetical protein JSW58_15830 [Candidatus Latescibacterota bacterium]
MLAAAALTLVMMIGCTAGPNQLVDSPNDAGRVAGFWHGLWHGFIVLFTFVISLFSDNVRIYEVHNSGNWYNLGFLLGVMIFFGGGCGGASKKTRCRRPNEGDSKK